MSVHPPPLGALAIDLVREDDTATLVLQGELDIASAPALEEHLGTIEEDAPPRVVIDLGGVAFIDSTGLRVLLQANARAAERAHELVLRPGAAAVQRVFETTGVSAAFRFESAPAA
jgi:anti-sigma B factor antagonist